MTGYTPQEMLATSFGSHTVCYGNDRGKNVVLVIERGEKYKGTFKEGYGLPSGHLKIGSEIEQLNDCAYRELCEEIKIPSGAPAFAPDKDRLTIKNITLLSREAQAQGNFGDIAGKIGASTTYYYELNKQEISLLNKHINAIQSDPEYKTAVKSITNNEVTSIQFFEAKELKSLIEKEKIKFAYPSEKKACLDLASQLASNRGKNRV
jgi:8-oxo-dGTP pyrophosphatase MutT (NUDIX family)